MIHKLLNLTRPLFVLDTETCGTQQDARIVELGFEMWVPKGPCKNCENQLTALKAGLITEIPPCPFCEETRHVDGGMAKEWRSLINPQVSIPPAATEVHHITDAMVQGCQVCKQDLGWHGDLGGPDAHSFKPWPTFKQLALSLASGLHDCDFAGQSVRFDLQRLAFEMKRNGQPWSYAGARIIDSSRLETLAEPRSLSDLHRKYAGLAHDGAHGALSDVRASATVLVGQLERYPQLPRDMDALHALQWPGWLTADGGFRMVNGVATIMFGKHRYKPLRDVPADYFDWLLKNDFPDEVKKLASEAKLKRYPEDKV